MNFSRARTFFQLNWKVISVTIALFVLASSLVEFVRFIDGLNSYCNVHRADDRDEVLYRLGYPPYVLGEPEKADGGYWTSVYWTDREANPKNAMPANKEIKDFRQWSYDIGPKGEENGTITVAFDHFRNRVESISCMATPGFCPSLAGIVIDDTEEQVQKKLGKPSRYKRDGVSKTIRYDDLGLEFLLTKGKIYSMTWFAARAKTTTIMLRYLQTFPH